MKRVLGTLALAVVVAAAMPVMAQEVAEGQWINLFDGETLMGWTAFGDADWQAKDGAMMAMRGTNGFLASTCQFADFELVAKIRVKGQGSAGVAVRSALSGHTSETGAAALVLPATLRDAKVQEVVVKALGNDVSATVDGVAVEGFSASNGRGHICFQFQRYEGDRRAPKVEIMEVKLRPLHLKPIFNGKDLEGWNVIPGHKSIFSVVDGALNIKDGNGQIETAGLYKDFVLQLDIISNGDHLNSGVFFRGPAGVFWKGYESQVRNQWEKERTHPCRLRYRGIYGDQEARKVVSTDHEWFNKTLICEGNHIAVWIDGYQVSDYYDTRPVSEDANGKRGYVNTAGTIHLQGHDPTTDLSFKNINVQEYPNK